MNPPKFEAGKATTPRISAVTPVRMRPSPRNQVISPQMISSAPMTRVDTPDIEEICTWMLETSKER